MKTFKNIYKDLMLILIGVFLLSSCKKDDELILPSAENIEIGIRNEQKGYIGQDFHFNAMVTAGTRLEEIEIRIIPKAGQNYEKDWQLELIWGDYVGMRNVEIHRHFDIPSDAPTGLYDFQFIVHDQNGAKLQLTYDFTILSGDAPQHVAFTIL